MAPLGGASLLCRLGADRASALSASASGDRILVAVDGDGLSVYDAASLVCGCGEGGAGGAGGQRAWGP